jgi:hypothetical protein
VRELAAVAVALGVLACVAAVAAFDLYCLARALAADRTRFLPAPLWAMLIVGVSPAGGAAYLLCQRRPARAPGPVPR